MNFRLRINKHPEINRQTAAITAAKTSIGVVWNCSIILQHINGPQPTSIRNSGNMRYSRTSQRKFALAINLNTQAHMIRQSSSVTAVPVKRSDNSRVFSSVVF